jgi:hypothetical protein
LITVLGQETGADPTARNSNLLPVKANGLVRLRSPEWRGICGSVIAPRSIAPPLSVRLGVPFSSCSMMSVSMSPRKIEMIAGGASLAPRRWSFPALAIVERSRSACRSTARMTAQRNVRNWRFVCVSSRGSSRLTPVSVDIDQLLCLPEPLTPANGFSWRRPGGRSAGRPAERLHDEHLVVAGDVGVLEDRRELVLARRDLVVPGLDRDAEAVELVLDLGHERDDALRGWRRSSGRRAAGPWGAWRRRGCARSCEVGAGEVEVRSIRKYSCSVPRVV